MDNTTIEKIQGNWNEIKGKLKEEYGELTDDDLTYQKGQEDQLVGKIQQKIGKTKEEFKQWIDKI